MNEAISRLMDGFVLRKSRTASRPCPNRSPLKEYQAPDFSTTRFSTPISTNSPAFEIPSANMMSNSACLKGGAILFFTTFTRTRLPPTSWPSLMDSIRRISSRTEE